ncbi:hypothetical protein [Zooshikella sp. RANM57]|uniref:hypothetical protein n=1 Tax=Zooshikella sp. RANM57 TaxID=3425863 RepID=UPI003D6E4DBB
MKSSRIGLLDADLLAYQAAAAAQTTIDWGNDWWTYHADARRIREILDVKIKNISQTCTLDEVIMCFSDTENFRMKVYPLYKSHRKDVPKPCGYPAAVAYLEDNYTIYRRPSLEADDVMGILATWPAFKRGCTKIIVSEDKDLKTIPDVYIYNPNRDLEPEFNSKEVADYHFYLQTLTGDTTDGYPGCPGIGDSVAVELLKDKLKFEAYTYQFKKGPRKGTTQQRWTKSKSESPWTSIVSCYLRAGLAEDDAIEQARCARILRACDYDFKKKEVILWSPKI